MEKFALNYLTAILVVVLLGQLVRLLIRDDGRLLLRLLRGSFLLVTHSTPGTRHSHSSNFGWQP